jgi:hypothetical protein
MKDKTALRAKPRKGVAIKAIKPDFLAEFAGESRSFFRLDEGSSILTARKPVTRAPTAQAERCWVTLFWIREAGLS